MGRWILGLTIGVVALAVVTWGNLGADTDATVPPTLTPYVEPAREAARHQAGLVGLLPARFIDARCTVDGRTVVLAFESAVSRAPLFAAIGDRGLGRAGDHRDDRGF